MYHRLSNMDMFFSEAFDCNYSQHSIEFRRAAWIAFVKFVEKNVFPWTFQYAARAHMNIHDTSCMMAHPVFQINGNFTILVQMTFICTCTNCNSKLAYSEWLFIDLLHSRSSCGSVDKTTDSQPWGPDSNLLAAVVVLLGKALYPHCLVPQKGLKVIGPWLVACYMQLAFLVAR